MGCPAQQVVSVGYIVGRPGGAARGASRALPDGGPTNEVRCSARGLVCPVRVSPRRLVLALVLDSVAIFAIVFLKGNLRIFALCLGGGLLIGTVIGFFAPKREVADPDIERYRKIPILGRFLTLGFWWCGMGRRSGSRRAAGDRDRR